MNIEQISLTGSENGRDLYTDLRWLRRNDIAVNERTPELEIGLNIRVGARSFRCRRIVYSCQFGSNA